VLGVSIVDAIARGTVTTLVINTAGSILGTQEKYFRFVLLTRCSRLGYTDFGASSKIPAIAA
jgi:hypothetical protein